MSNYQTNALESQDLPSSSQSHKEAVDVEGLEHLFRWASEVVADGEDVRVKAAREKRVRRQVLEVVQKAHEQKAVAKVNDEMMYLQRRVIALLQKIQDVTEENSILRQITISQFYALDKIPTLEAEIRQLQGYESEREAAVSERRYLMDALAKVKRERDYLDELLNANEAENVRAARLISEAKEEIAKLKARTWFSFFCPWLK